MVIILHDNAPILELDDADFELMLKLWIDHDTKMKQEDFKIVGGETANSFVRE